MPLIHRTCLGGIAALWLATGALADLTAEAVWNDWRGYVESFGHRVNATPARDGDRLVLSGVRIAPDDADEALGTTILMDRIVLTEEADGSVRITLPAVMPVTVEATDPSGGRTRVSMDYRQTGLDILATGSEGAIDYAYRADTIALETTGVQRGGRTLSPSEMALDFTLEGLSGETTSRRQAGSMRYGQDLVVASVRYRVIGTDLDTGTRSKIIGQTRDLGFRGESTVPGESGPGRSIAELADAGLRSSGRFTHAANAVTLLLDAPSGPSETALTTRDGTLDVALEDGAATYTATQNGLQAEIASARLAQPVQFAIARSVFDMRLPVSANGEAGALGVGMSLDGVTLSDRLWTLIDPGGQVPRDPATVRAELAGTGRLGAGARVPELDTVEIKALRIAAGGAEITGSGAFDVLRGVTGQRLPQGALDLTLTGGNGLIDRLIATGFLPEQHAMGLRMMLGFLAVPGAGPDTFTSRIEITEDGQVLANGQRIR